MKCAACAAPPPSPHKPPKAGLRIAAGAERSRRDRSVARFTEARGQNLLLPVRDRVEKSRCGPMDGRVAQAIVVELVLSRGVP
jgi:hypothetical protein